MLLRQLSYAIKYQRKARNAPSRGLWVPFAGSLWHKGYNCQLDVSLKLLYYDNYNFCCKQVNNKYY